MSYAKCDHIGDHDRVIDSVDHCECSLEPFEVVWHAHPWRPISYREW